MNIIEQDIPGASLDGRDAATLTIPALRRWLQCRAAPTTGKKAELVERYIVHAAACTLNKIIYVYNNEK